MASNPRRIMPGAPCLECRRRKIGCNRSRPCSYCVKTKIQCIYPAPTVAPSTDGTDKTEYVQRRVDGVEERLSVLERHMNEIKQLVMDRNSPSRGLQDANRPVSEAVAVATHETALSSQATQSIITIEPAQESNEIFSPMTLVAMWQTYLERVDPLLKLIHVPSTQKIVMQACKDIKIANPNTVCLTYAIAYAAIVSMSPMECISDLQHNPQGPNVHGLIGMAIGIAIKMHLNRDGDKSDISTFEAEMRRRLWWHILTLDVLAAQDKSTDPCVLGSSFNTRTPSNVSDSQLDPDMSRPPADRPENTEMTFTLCNFTVTFYSRQLMFSSDFCHENPYPILSVQEKCDAIRILEKQIEVQYLQYFDESVPLQRITMLATRLNLLKMKLSVNGQSSKESGSRYDQQFIQDCALYTDYVSSMKNCQKSSYFMWFFDNLLNWSV
ncbi:hypothetical protein TSTA_044570 [Talaromyces stipitatus ATCC 10500]|uniref:Zn(2)-C6 fungal-type domain-containing protein n=1 Tax=Talaromyces stipitatus (strain ATCC 10500 / CBS 375.48 / QM 6759 / NRRL 1006) TaxID=441959 RepID=B8ML76_TALSN|nr:uncharacterized protein TSTA_044570 [Talaromyces stipitatus ATCC 10500]EED14991.1 hypothetical protein TSTA_044570 [Talaromyces stipitatus ATCC 10500]